MVEPWQIERLSDDDMIDCYNTCPDCGARQLAPAQLAVAIARAADADDFLARLQLMSSGHQGARA